MSNIILEDTTLRDGEQSPGVAFSKERKISIFSSLIDAGVKWLEIGIPTMGGDELNVLKYLLERKDEGVLVAWNRGVKADVLQSIDLGFDAVHIGLPTSDLHLGSNLKKDRGWLLKTSSDLIKLAKDRGVFVSISAEDVGRSELGFVEEYAAHVAESGADRIRLSDTVGILTPERYGDIVGRVKRASGIAVQCHAHNDFGLATANTLAGIQAGATYFHVTVNGIGERAGMPDLAQCVLALKILYNIDVGIDETKLVRLSEMVAESTNVSCYPWQPIIGENVFTHESGIHANGILKNSGSFEPFLPELVGRTRRIVIGKHSGRGAIDYVLRTLGVEPTGRELSECLRVTRALSMETGQGIRNEALLSIISAVRDGSA